jgi:hypothetical protein
MSDNTSPLRAIAAFLALLAAPSIRAAEQVSTPVIAANAVPPSDCAVEGEPLDQRIARLETALRLAKAEAAVNRKRKRK